MIKNSDKFIQRYLKLQENKYGWSILDEAIFNAVRKYPDHTNPKEIFAKIALVNRTYRANLEFARKNAEWELALAFAKQSEKIDHLLRPLKSLTCFTKTEIPVVVEVNEKIGNIALEVLSRRSISFISKYLSFHFPQAVPIYDNKSRITLAKLIDRTRCEGSYSDHCNGIAELVDELFNHGIQYPSLKLIDCVLYRGSG